MVIFIVVVLLKLSEAAEMSAPEVKVMFGGAEVLNSNPAGALNISVTPEPVEMSDLLPSRMTMAPSDVQVGKIALAALSAEILAPPVAAVIVTAPNARPASRHTKATARVNRTANADAGRQQFRPEQISWTGRALTR